MARMIELRPVALSALLGVALMGFGCAEERPPAAALERSAGAIDGVEYVDVRHEPQHRHEFENDRLRIYDVLLPPGYVTLYHAHFRDTLYAVVQGSSLKSRALVGSGIPVALPVPSGTLMWNPHSSEPLIHEVINAGTGTARLLGVEFQSQGVFERPVLQSPGLELADTHPGVRVYRLQLGPGAQTEPLDIAFSGLLVALSEATLTVAANTGVAHSMAMEPAGWQLWEQSGELVIVNAGVAEAELLIYEMP